MTTRLLSLPLLVVAATSLACVNQDDGPDVGEGREPYIDSWRVEASGPASQVTSLQIGNRLTSNNFANRGNIEVRYESGIDQITIEMQRFTVAKTQADADAAFGRMHLWAYDIASPKPPTADDATKACWAEGVTRCYVRNYYEGQLQPVRDGVNFRVTIPAGWNGNLVLTTQDNLGEGIDSYPDRSDIIVDGVAGNLTVNMDSGNVAVRMDPNTKHFASCPSNDTCVEEGYAMGCGCSEPTNISIANQTGQSSDITVDVGNPDAWYTMLLENRGSFSASDDFVCTATIDCGPFETCEIDSDYASLEFHERAEVNYPGEPAISGAGMRIALVSESCSNITYVNGPEDYEIDEFPADKRGDLHVCVGCLNDL
ncbi:MAG: hypothetical protein R6X02_16015 [Enhygromyxa sp.]